MLKLLRLLILLSGNRCYTLVELMERFEQSDRTIYRHLNAIQRAGFILKCKEGKKTPAYDTIKKAKYLYHFSNS